MATDVYGMEGSKNNILMKSMTGVALQVHGLKANSVHGGGFVSRRRRSDHSNVDAGN
jgi:hypothetical protein